MPKSSSFITASQLQDTLAAGGVTGSIGLVAIATVLEEVFAEGVAFGRTHPATPCGVQVEATDRLAVKLYGLG